MKNKILPTCLQGNYRDSLGELSNTSYGVFEADKVKSSLAIQHQSKKPRKGLGFDKRFIRVCSS